MVSPRIVVCVITYNQRDFIEKCLRSILDQKVDAVLEVLVGDDSSTDGTSEIIAGLVNEYGPRLKHFKWSPNVGALTNLCRLMVQANGDFISRVDGDDYWLPGKLDRQMNYMKLHRDCVAVFTNAITVNEAGEQMSLFNDLGDTSFDLSRLIRRGNVLNNSSVLFRSKFKGIWSDKEELIDYELHLKLAEGGSIGHIGAPLTAYRIHSQGSMVTTSNEYVRQLYWKSIQSVPRNLISDGDYVRGLADFLRRVFFRAIRTRDTTLFLVWAKRVFSNSPYGYASTAVHFSLNVLRMLFKTLSSKVYSPRGFKRVLYRH